MMCSVGFNGKPCIVPVLCATNSLGLDSVVQKSSTWAKLDARRTQRKPVPRLGGLQQGRLRTDPIGTGTAGH